MVNVGKLKMWEMAASVQNNTPARAPTWAIISAATTRTASVTSTEREVIIFGAGTSEVRDDRDLEERTVKRPTCSSR